MLYEGGVVRWGVRVWGSETIFRYFGKLKGVTLDSVLLLGGHGRRSINREAYDLVKYDDSLIL